MNYYQIQFSFCINTAFLNGDGLNNDRNVSSLLGGQCLSSNYLHWWFSILSHAHINISHSLSEVLASPSIMSEIQWSGQIIEAAFGISKHRRKCLRDADIYFTFVRLSRIILCLFKAHGSTFQHSANYIIGVHFSSYTVSGTLF